MSRNDDQKPSSRSGPAPSVPVRLGSPNPQGKGLVGLLDDWAKSQPVGVVAKRPGRILADYFTSLLVLSSDFGFKPVHGQTYYLYLLDGAWRLSLVSPDEWNTETKRTGYVGACVLHEDATWSIAPSDNLGRAGPVTEALAGVYRAFVERLGVSDKLEDGLPVYEAQLSYHQRLYAAALGRSIGGSISSADLGGKEIGYWLERLPKNSNQLLERTRPKD